MSTPVVFVAVDVVVKPTEIVTMETVALPLVMTVVVSVDVACSVPVELMVTSCVVAGIESREEQYDCARARWPSACRLSLNAEQEFAGSPFCSFAADERETEIDSANRKCIAK